MFWVRLSKLYPWAINHLRTVSVIQLLSPRLGGQLNLQAQHHPMRIIGISRYMAQFFPCLKYVLYHARPLPLLRSVYWCLYIHVWERKKERERERKQASRWTEENRALDPSCLCTLGDGPVASSTGVTTRMLLLSVCVRLSDTHTHHHTRTHSRARRDRTGKGDALLAPLSAKSSRSINAVRASSAWNACQERVLWVSSVALYVCVACMLSVCVCVCVCIQAGFGPGRNMCKSVRVQHKIITPRRRPFLRSEVRRSPLSGPWRGSEHWRIIISRISSRFIASIMPPVFRAGNRVGGAF